MTDKKLYTLTEEQLKRVFDRIYNAADDWGGPDYDGEMGMFFSFIKSVAEAREGSLPPAELEAYFRKRATENGRRAKEKGEKDDGWFSGKADTYRRCAEKLREGSLRTPTAPTDERGQFELWVSSQIRNGMYGWSLARQGNGYDQGVTHSLWLGWKARGEASQPAPATCAACGVLMRPTVRCPKCGRTPDCTIPEAQTAPQPTPRKENYYRDILRRIAAGYPTPDTLAQFALEHEFHDKDCRYITEQDADCTCGAAEAPAQPSPAMCSCLTAHEAHTFGGRPMQYCPGVKCPWCGSAAKFDWKKSNEHLCRNIGHFAGEFEAAASPSAELKG
jgi:hypothetical protein